MSRRDGPRVGVNTTPAGKPFQAGGPQRGRPFAKGHDSRREAGKAKAGRKTVAFIDECHRLSDEAVLPKLEEKLRKGDPDDAAWRWAAERVLEYSKRKAAQALEVTGTDGSPLEIIVTRRIIRARDGAPVAAPAAVPAPAERGDS